MPIVNDTTYTIRRGYLVPYLLEGFLRLRMPSPATAVFDYLSGVVLCDPLFCNFWGRSSLPGESDATFFSLSHNISEPIMNSLNYQFLCLSKIRLIFSYFGSLSAFSLVRLEHTISAISQCPGSATLEIHDASEPVPFTFPEVRYLGIIYLSMVLLAASVFSLCVFIWHFWSIRFQIMNKVIRDSGLTIHGRRGNSEQGSLSGKGSDDGGA
jgi:hypothetical protein